MAGWRNLDQFRIWDCGDHMPAGGRNGQLVVATGNDQGWNVNPPNVAFTAKQSPAVLAKGILAMFAWDETATLGGFTFQP